MAVTGTCVYTDTDEHVFETRARACEMTGRTDESTTEVELAGEYGREEGVEEVGCEVGAKPELANGFELEEDGYGCLQGGWSGIYGESWVLAGWTSYHEH